MIQPHEQGMDLVTSDIGSRLFRDWLGGKLAIGSDPAEVSGATDELRYALNETNRPAQPLRPAISGRGGFFASGPGEAWALRFRAELTDGLARETFERNWSQLRKGAASVVITGQQPGFLGGPLYTLYKAATTVSLAVRRTRSGRPTVPVFWCGDDDDDLVEALSPWCWDPQQQRLWGHSGRLRNRRQTADRITVGSLSAARWSEQTLTWLDGLKRTGSDKESPDTLPVRLTELWRRAVAEDWTWSRLNRRLLLLLLGDHGLLIVSGSDARLHEVAAPLYRRILADGPRLADIVRDRGRELAAAGYHTQLQESSLRRPLFRLDEGRRLPVDDWPGAVTADLRPGVMLRALIQDWLFDPAAVVVGPGELAYLRQLDRLYDHLDLPRCPLVPRLMAQLIPTGTDAADLKARGPAGVTGREKANSDAATVVATGRQQLIRILMNDYGLELSRAETLAEQRTRRWTAGLAKMLEAEGRHLAKSRLVDLPPWFAPDGQRQERSLALAGVLAWQGTGLLNEILTAADRHLTEGLAGRWREVQIEIDPRAEGR